MEDILDAADLCCLFRNVFMIIGRSKEVIVKDQAKPFNSSVIKPYFGSHILYFSVSSVPHI